jgi:hypothetical protein
MPSLYDWSTTATANATADPLIDWREGMPPSGVNDSGRAMMKRVKELLLDLGGSLAAGGTANALTLATASAFAAYADGQIVAFRAAVDNTSAATLNVNNIGAKSLRKVTVAGDVPLSGGEVQGGGIYLASYSTALNGSAGGWLILNPTNDFATLASAQTLSNKTLPDASTAFVDDGDATKKLLFQLSGFTTATTRTVTWPDASGTVVLLDAAQTLTGKTLTSPTINGPTITSPTVTGLDASETAKGLVEMATTTEASTGTDTSRAVTAAGVKAAIDARVYTGSLASNTNYPVSEILFVLETAAAPARNASVNVRLDTGNTVAYRTDGAGSLMSGVWRSRGTLEVADGLGIQAKRTA